MAEVDIKNSLIDQLRRIRSRTLTLIVITFSVIGVLIGYYIVSDIFSGPFKNVSVDLLGESSVRVSFETKSPAKTKVQYGTNDIYMNEVSVSSDFSSEHDIDLKNLLPQRLHMIKLFAKEASGREYLSPVYKIK